MTNQTNQPSAVQHIKQVLQVTQQRAGALAEEYELHKKYTVLKAKVAAVVQTKVEPYHQQAMEKYDALKTSGVEKISEVKVSAADKVREGKQKMQTTASESLAKLYAYAVAFVAWAVTCVARLFLMTRALVQKKATELYNNNSNVLQDKVPLKVAETAEKAVGFATEKGAPIAVSVKSTVASIEATVVSTAESAVAWCDARLLHSRGVPAVKQLVADIRAAQEKQQQQQQSAAEQQHHQQHQKPPRTPTLNTPPPPPPAVSMGPLHSPDFSSASSASHSHNQQQQSSSMSPALAAYHRRSGTAA